MDSIFDGCVRLLVYLAAQTGLTYKQINVWVFVFIWPILTLVLVGIIVRQQMLIKSLRKT
jgi:hypothetical protein